MPATTEVFFVAIKVVAATAKVVAVTSMIVATAVAKVVAAAAKVVAAGINDGMAAVAQSLLQQPRSWPRRPICSRKKMRGCPWSQGRDGDRGLD